MWMPLFPPDNDCVDRAAASQLSIGIRVVRRSVSNALFCAYCELCEQVFRSFAAKVLLNHAGIFKFLYRVIQSFDVFLSTRKVSCIARDSVYPDGDVDPATLKQSEKFARLIVWW
jgi:hypothetical protein